MSMNKTKLAMATAALLSAAGCSEYKYFDVHVSFDQPMYFAGDAVQNLTTSCYATVSGAAKGSFPLKNGICPNLTGVGSGLDGGTFEFSTFATSGTITFQVDGYSGLGMDPNCITGTGSTPVTVVGDSMIKAEVVIKKTGKPACTNGSGPTGTDAGI